MPALDALLTGGWGFVLVLVRASALVVVAPVLGAHVVPARVRLALATALAFAAWLAAGPVVPMPTSIARLAAQAAAEALVGLAAGLAARVVLDAAVGAGQVAGLSTGLGYGALVNPLSGELSAAPGELFGALAVGLGVAAGLHREAVRWLVRGLVAAPPGEVFDFQQLARAVSSQAIVSAVMALRLAFPVLAAVLVAHVAVGLVGRSAQQLNLASISFAVSLAAGGGAAYLVAPEVAEVALRLAVSTFGAG